MQLDSKGFVFIDITNVPYFVNMRDGVPWLWYWSYNNNWVSYRQISDVELMLFYEQKISDEQAQIYLKKYGK